MDPTVALSPHEISKPPFRRFFGGGIEWTKRLGPDIRAHLSDRTLREEAGIQCVEIIAENFFENNQDNLETLRHLARLEIPVLIHSVELSLGSADGFREQHFARIRGVADQVNAICYSDHVGYCRAFGMETGQPAILPFSVDAADCVIRNVEEAMASINLPFLIENEANRYLFSQNELSEPAFFNRILEATGCGLLLDLTNLYTNAVNFGIDPIKWLDEINLEFVREIHLAGGSFDFDGVLLDNHAADVPASVWDLLAYCASRTKVEAIIVERSENEPPFKSLLAEISKATKSFDFLDPLGLENIPFEVAATDHAHASGREI
jgi:uncharacterized protein